MRDAATDQPHYDLRRLASLEERLEAHIDGLRVAEDAGLEIAWAQAEQYGEPGELFAIATLALESRHGTMIEQVLRFAESVPKSRRGLFGALGWVSRDALRGHVVTWLASSSAFRRLVGVIACSLHRADPTTRMENLLADEPSVRARALRLAGELGRIDLQRHARVALNQEDDACRFWAAWSAALLGERLLPIAILQAYAAAAGTYKWRALDLVLRLMERDAAIGWLRELGRDPSHARMLVVAAGVLGDPLVVPWLLQKMSVPTLARVAGESFSTITGVDLSEQGLDDKPPADFSAGPVDDPHDESVTNDPDENLAWPAATKLEAWWEKMLESFPAAVKHLKGSPLTQENCNAVIRTGYQRQRRAAAYELALMNPGHPLWNWRAKSAVQANQLRSSAQPLGS